MYESNDAIAKIEIDGTGVRGTGFLVASDLVATALHVVADRSVEPPIFFPGTIRLKFRYHTSVAEVIPDKWNQDADCVLLRCVDPVPLALYPAIPLRALDHSDDLFKTYGFPDAQPIDGMVWAGRVRNDSAQLTNFYQTRKAAYRPVLQLFSEEAGAGTGAPPKGLSGAPVVVGTAAVGLLRFALMQDGSAVAGTLYACTAQDVVALDPKRLSLRPPLAAVTILTPEQTTRLITLLDDAFQDNLNGLRRAVRFSLGVEAERNVTSTKNLHDFVSILISLLLQQGPGIVGVLLRGTIAARPTDQRLRTFAEQVSTYALEPVDDDPDVQDAHDDKLVTEISSALIDLSSMRRQAPKLQQIIGSYRPDFEKTRLQIRILAKYKELHHCLHSVQDRLDTITNNVTRLREGHNVLLYLKDDASFLRELVKKARNQIVGLPTADEEKEWIDVLDACAVAVKAAADDKAPIAERETVLDVPERLARILPQASHINEELVDAAKQVRLDNFAETMRSVEKQFGKTMPEDSMKLLRDASLAVGRLRSRLAGLIAEHDEWQSLNTDLEYTKTQSKHQPQAKFSSWRQFKAKLLGLCDVFPNEEWSVDLKEMMLPWMADEPPPEPQIPANIAKLDGDFLSFNKLCVERFIEVDDELNRLSKKVVMFATPLDVLLKP